MSVHEPLSAERRAELRETAEAATQEAWLQDECIEVDDSGAERVALAEGVHVYTDGGALDLTFYEPEIRTDTTANAAHVAAFDPPTVLALLDQADEAARLAGEVERLRAALGEITDAHPERDHDTTAYKLQSIARHALRPPTGATA